MVTTVSGEETAERPFSNEEYVRRLGAVRRWITSRSWTALVIVDPGNIHYLTGLDRVGYFSFTCLILPSHTRAVLVARAMEEPTVRMQCPDVDFVGYDEGTAPGGAVAQALRLAGLVNGCVGVEKSAMYLPVAVYEQAVVAAPALSWVDGSGVVDAVSRVKSPHELEYMSKAARLSELAVENALAVARRGASEAEVASAAYRALLADGNDHPGFPPLVRATRRIHYEHVTAGKYSLSGDGLFVEVSGCVNRYHAPMTRTRYFGAPREGDLEAAEIALAGLTAVQRALRPGAVTGDAYAAWQAVIDQALGRKRYHRHNCGHLVGYGFFPGWFGGSQMIGLNHGGTVEIREGMTIHVFSWLSGPACPGNYVVSDTLVVGAIENEFVTTTPRSPVDHGPSLQSAQNEE